MKFTIKKQIFAHDLINPPTEASSCNIELPSNSPDCMLKLEKGRVSYCTSYTLSVEDALQLGFTSAEQSLFIREFQNLILAFNLTLSRVCMTIENFYVSHGGINIIPPESKVSTERIGNQTRVNVEETIVLRDEVQITVGLSETFVCQSIVELFQKLQSLRGHDSHNNTTVELSNISKALREYESAISAYTRITKFKHLFNALELVANKDGKKRESDVFDLHVANLSSVQQTDVEEWRELYNRTKHADRNSADIETYLSGIKHIGSKYLLPLRRCYQDIILSLL
jgi:hypothetical protein